MSLVTHLRLACIWMHGTLGERRIEWIIVLSIMKFFTLYKKKLKGRSAGPLLGRLAEQPSKQIVTLRTAKHGKRRPSAGQQLAGWRLA
jgi:hypothetical protein